MHAHSWLVSTLRLPVYHSAIVSLHVKLPSNHELDLIKYVGHMIVTEQWFWCANMWRNLFSPYECNVCWSLYSDNSFTCTSFKSLLATIVPYSFRPRSVYLVGIIGTVVGFICMADVKGFLDIPHNSMSSMVHKTFARQYWKKVYIWQRTDFS